MHERVIARFTVDQAGEMTEKGRREIADWLRIQADLLEEEGPQYAEFYVARYIAVTHQPVDFPTQKELDFG